MLQAIIDHIAPPTDSDAASRHRAMCESDSSQVHDYKALRDTAAEFHSRFEQLKVLRQDPQMYKNDRLDPFEESLKETGSTLEPLMFRPETCVLTGSEWSLNGKQARSRLESMNRQSELLEFVHFDPGHPTSLAHMIHTAVQGGSTHLCPSIEERSVLIDPGEISNDGFSDNVDVYKWRAYHDLCLSHLLGLSTGSSDQSILNDQLSTIAAHARNLGIPVQHHTTGDFESDTRANQALEQCIDFTQYLSDHRPVSTEEMQANLMIIKSHNPTSTRFDVFAKHLEESSTD